MKAKILSRAQVTIPSAIRRRLGLKPGVKLLFDETADYIKATKMDSRGVRAGRGKRGRQHR